MSEAKRPRCPVCGKLFWCDYPNRWVYKRDRVFLCSWGCMRKWDAEGKEAKKGSKSMKEEKTKRIFRDQVETGRQMADAVARGEDPIEFLRGLGYGNPEHAYANIIRKLREEAPEVAARIPRRSCARKPEAGKPAEEKKPEVVLTINHEELAETDGDEEEEPVVELVYDPSIAEEYRREQAAKAKQQEPEQDERDIWHTAAVRNKKMGTFYYDEKFRTIDWRHPYGEEISLPPEDWKWLGDHIGMILHALGVDDG